MRSENSGSSPTMSGASSCSTIAATSNSRAQSFCHLPTVAHRSARPQCAPAMPARWCGSKASAAPPASNTASCTARPDRAVLHSVRRYAHVCTTGLARTPVTLEGEKRPKTPCMQQSAKMRRVLVKAKSGWALILVAAWGTPVPVLVMTVKVAIHPRNLVASLSERCTMDEQLDTFVYESIGCSRTGIYAPAVGRNAPKTLGC